MIKYFITPAAIVCTILATYLPSASAQQTPPKKPAGAIVPPKPAPPKPDPSKPLSEQIDMSKVSYLIGRSYGDNLKRQFVDVNFEELVRGLKSAIEGAESEITEQGEKKLMDAFRPLHGAHVALQRKLSAFGVDQKGWTELAAKNKADGEKFLAENAAKDGVKTTASGLQYEILKPGTGEIPKPSDTVNAIYKGTLLDGTVFDDSKGAARPFGVSRVVKGWTEALQMMPVGSKWRLTVPGDLAYGPGGHRPPIGPNATILFEMELASIKKPIQAVTPPVGITIPPRKGTPAKPKKRITATTPPVSVPIPKKKEEAPKPAEK
jgi:FKBP-type peptidyl-prolyl cis-trans isomerase FklB